MTQISNVVLSKENIIRGKIDDQTPTRLSISKTNFGETNVRISKDHSINIIELGMKLKNPSKKIAFKTKHQESFTILQHEMMKRRVSIPDERQTKSQVCKHETIK